jgi:hypothetical protein
VGPILEYGAECWDLYTEGHVIMSDPVQKQTAKFATRTNASVWETLAQGRKISLQRVHRGTRMERYRGQATRTILPKQGRFRNVFISEGNLSG